MKKIYGALAFLAGVVVFPLVLLLVASRLSGLPVGIVEVVVAWCLGLAVGIWGYRRVTRPRATDAPPAGGQQAGE